MGQIEIVLVCLICPYTFPFQGVNIDTLQKICFPAQREKDLEFCLRNFELCQSFSSHMNRGINLTWTILAALQKGFTGISLVTGMGLQT